MNKYRHAFLLGLQSNLVYRMNFAVRGFFTMFHLAVVFILWSAAYLGIEKMGGYTFGQTLTYFLVMLVMQFFVGAFNEDYQISEEIRNGLINQFLLKPINYFLYRFSIFLAARLVTGALILIPLLLVVPLLREYLVLPAELWRLPAGLAAMGLSALIQFSIAYCFGLLTFWFLEIQGFVILSMAVESLLGGQMFPLDLLPPIHVPLTSITLNTYEIAQHLPFYYQSYFPTAIFTGRINELSAVSQGLMIQLCWVVVLLSVNQLLWTRGLRRHTAVGG